jgi:hypothetical protein
MNPLPEPPARAIIDAMPATPPPFVFVSYSHDSETHAQHVLSFVRQLRADGIDAHCDREVIAPAQGWVRWMHDHLRLADYVLAVCTPAYAERAEGRAPPVTGRGATFEGAVIGQELYDAGMTSNKFHPVGFGPLERAAVPFFLRGRATFDVATPAGYEDLYRLLTGQLAADTGVLGSLRKAAAAVPPLRDFRAPEAAVPAGPPIPGKALVGIAIDVSESMKKSLPRDLGESSSRMQAVRGALEKVGQKARRIAATFPEGERDNVRLFAYGFGLRLDQLAVCDMLTLIDAVRMSTTTEEIEAAKRDVERQAGGLMQRHSALIGLAETFLGKDRVSIVSKQFGEDAVHKVILERSLARMQSLGDTTISIADFADLWSGSGDAFAQAEEVIFGNTPLRAMFQQLIARFEAEGRRGVTGATNVLFLLSDGMPTDGDPGPLAAQLAKDVTIVSCYVADTDVTAARTMFAAPDSAWTKAARLMFDMASVADDENPFLQSLRAHGWIVPAGVRLFIQVNRSDILEEFIGGLAAFAGEVSGPARD